MRAHFSLAPQVHKGIVDDILSLLYVPMEGPGLKMALFLRHFGHTPLHGLIKWYLSTLKRFGVTGRVLCLEECLDLVNHWTTHENLVIGDCRCKVAQGIKKGVCSDGCPMEKDIQIGAAAKHYLRMFPDQYRTISKKELNQKLKEFDKQGLIHTLYFERLGKDGGLFEELTYINACYRGQKKRAQYWKEISEHHHADRFYSICNCCPRSCIPMRVGFEYRIQDVLNPGTFKAQLKPGKKGCIKCLGKCAFSALSYKNGRVIVDSAKCMGCGKCRLCTCKSLKLVPRAKFQT